MLWAAVGIGYKKLIVLDQNVTEAVYVGSILKPTFADLKKNRRIFQFDNAKSHVAKRVTAMLSNEGIRTIASEFKVSWPVASGDDLGPCRSGRAR